MNSSPPALPIANSMSDDSPPGGSPPSLPRIPAGVSTSNPDNARFAGASAKSCRYIFFSAVASRAITSPAAENGVALQPASHAASPRAYAANQPSAAARTSLVTSGTATVGAALGFAVGTSSSPRGRGVGSRDSRRGPPSPPDATGGTP